MDRLDSIAAAERRRGWWIKLASGADGWDCRLECGANVLAANVPRPRASAPTAEEAVEAALHARNRLMREHGLKAVRGGR